MQAATFTSAKGLAGTRLAARRSSSRVQARAAVRVQANSAFPRGGSPWGAYEDSLGFFAGFLGWFAPSNIKVPAFGNESLFGAFHASMLENLANFPQGPALTDKFWILMVTWHMGLFACLFWGQIGVQARKQGYFN